MKFILIFVQLLVLETIFADEENVPIVKTNLGSVKGRYINSYEGRNVAAFEGIPFAKAPVDDLRFKEPQPYEEPWSEVLLANTTYVCIHYFPMLMTHGVGGTEDCLYMYVYVPLEKITGNENLDVVVHIHGGAFILGAPKYFAGPDYIIDKDVVYVSFNYRLGIFGFLSTEDDVVPGNNGMKDQVMALKWIQDNIKYFGGNPNSVTITGLSAGGASVHYHYLSPMSKGLFHRGYSQSGTALNTWALTENPLQKAKKVAAYLNCSTESSQEMVNCLRQKPSNEIILAMTCLIVFINAIPFAPFAPVVEHGKSEGAFLSDHPYKLLMEGKINDLPWVSSNVKQEGIYPVGFFIWYRKLPELDERWNELMPYALDFYDNVDDDQKIPLAKQFKEHYLNNQTLSSANVNRLVDLFTDRLFLYDSETALRMHSKVSKSPVYYSFCDYQLVMKTIFTRIITGTAHSDDARLWLKITANPETFPESDRKLKNNFIDFIYTFANTGKPIFKGIEWGPVSPTDDNINYLKISSPDDIEMKSMKNLVDVNFWDSLPIKENKKLFSS